MPDSIGRTESIPVAMISELRKWKYLYRAVDFLLTAKRDKAAARRPYEVSTTTPAWTLNFANAST